MLAIVAAVFVIVAVYVLNFYQKVKKYPPGPKPWPVVGNVLELPTDDTHKYVTKMREEYGPVYTVWQPQPVVYIQEFELVKDALVTHGDDYLGRTDEFPDTAFQIIHNGGVIFAQGDEWKEDRRLSLHILRDFGMGKNIMEEHVQISVQECIDHIRSLPDKKHVDPRWPIQLLVGNVINSILFGYHYKYNDCARLKNYCDGLAKLIVDPRTNRLVNMLQGTPWIKYVPILGNIAYWQHVRTRDLLYKHTDEDMEKNLKGYDVDHEPETFTQAYYQRTTKARTYKRDRLRNVLMDFFLAGSETTSTTLRWSFIILAQNPEVQEKIRAEIYEKLGKEKFVSMKDRANMPYCAAAAIEIQRYANILPFNVMHKTTVDTVCGKYKIPANTQIQAMINTVMAADPHFEDPGAFRPERFLESDGTTFKKGLVERVIPFSMGKRICAGEGLARMEIFIGLVSLVQHFRIKPPVDAPLVTKAIFGGVMIPPTNNFVIECL